MKKCTIIFNPLSGKDLKKDFMEEFQEILLKNDYSSTIFFTEYSKHAVKLIRDIEDTDLVISLGGDGTFNEIVTGNLQRVTPLLLAHIPLGTTNDIGAMFGYGRNVLNNLRLLLEGEVKGIDICTINNRPFVYVAGFGKFMNVPYETPRELKSKLGHFAYLIEGFKSFILPAHLYKMKYVVDGIEYNGIYSFVLVSNANRIAGISNFYKDVKLNDGCFEILICNLTKKTEIVRSLYYLATSNLTQAKGFEFYKVNEIELTFDNDNVPAWCIDGEKLHDNKYICKIKMVPNFKILMPKKNVKKLFI